MPSHPRPTLAGLRYIRVSHPGVIKDVHETAEAFIPGYNAASGIAAATQRQEQLRELFEGHEPPPPATITLLATDEDERAIYGGAILETPVYGQAWEQDPAAARGLAQFHRVLAALFVSPPAQGHGLGRHLMASIAGDEVLKDRARWIDGWVDDRSGSRGFYEDIDGVQVYDNEQGLPPRWPMHMSLTQDPESSGAWFCYDTWPDRIDSLHCSRCGGPLRFHDGKREGVECPNCPMPPNQPRRGRPGSAAQ